MCLTNDILFIQIICLSCALIARKENHLQWQRLLSLLLHNAIIQMISCYSLKSFDNLVPILEIVICILVICDQFYSECTCWSKTSFGWINHLGREQYMGNWLLREMSVTEIKYEQSTWNFWIFRTVLNDPIKWKLIYF